MELEGKRTLASQLGFEEARAKASVGSERDERGPLAQMDLLLLGLSLLLFSIWEFERFRACSKRCRSVV